VEAVSNAETTPKPEWVVTPSPHIRHEETTARIMWSVVAALAPAGVWAVWVFGWMALYVIALCVVSAVFTEAAVQKWRGKPVTLCDGSAVLTGLLLAYILPSHSLVIADGQITGLTWLRWQVPVLGAVFAIAVVKHCFGGLGCNIWNPALAGRAFVQVSFQSDVSLAQWPFPRAGTDAVTQATALARGPATPHYSVADLFFGNCPGSLGEVSAFLLLIGAAYLIFRKYVDWRLPLGYLLALVVFATLFAWSPPAATPPWVVDFAKSFAQWRAGDLSTTALCGPWLHYAALQVFSGGVILGAFFMATDMVTSPITARGQFFFGLGCGFLTAVIRFYSGYPEGVCYSILLMNTVRPYIDRWTRPRLLGQPRKPKASS
jgi:electron transport complex protein RnfD